MRSDYLGACAGLEGFAETVNRCQYLLPRMDDFALLRAIHEPAPLYGGSIANEVGDRLLFEARVRAVDLHFSSARSGGYSVSASTIVAARQMLRAG